MKNLIALTLSFVAVFSYLHVAHAQEENWKTWPKQAERTRDYDAIHYRIKLRFDENNKTFWGENTITLSPLADGFQTCVLDAEILRVTSVKNEDSEPLNFNQTEGNVVVSLSRPYNYDDTLSFTVSYVGKQEELDPQKYGMSPDYHLGLEFVDQSPNNPRLISTLSFPTGSRHWFPCYDHPNDKATSEIIVTVRSDYNAASNGRLVSVIENKKNKTKTFHWSQELPHSTYLFVLAAGPYEILKDSLGSLPINYWVYEKDVKDAMRSFHKTPEIIEFFNKVYGYPFPWAKYDQITIPGIGGGAESTSATVLGQSTIHNEKAEKDFPSHGLVAHEAAHQLWGTLTTLRDWGHTWLNESYATYGEYLYSRHSLGEDEGAVNLLQKKNAYLEEAHTRYMRPIVLDRWRFPNNNFDRHTYPKGAAVIHMMRNILGDGPFFRAHTHFLQKHAFKPVNTHDLQIAIREATGQNIDWFFDQWIQSPGHPVFDVSYLWDKHTKKLKVQIVQQQDTSEGIPIFRAPVVIGFVTPDGKRSEKVWIEEREEALEFDCGKKPLMVRFDEGNYLLKEWTFEKDVDELLYQLKNDDVVGKMWAASQLDKFSDNDRVVADLTRSARNDPFWAVRRTAVQTIGSWQEENQIDFLKEKSKDRNSKVRTASLKALGDYRKDELVGFFEERFEKDDSYVAQAEALRSIGKCGNRSSVPFIEKASSIRSPRNIIKTAAERALEEL
jgi:aminopeptidase N